MAQQMGWGLMEEGWRKGPWTAEEDRLLVEYVKLHGEGRWNNVARAAGLKRNGKSCRLRWVNYLRPDLKRGQITPHEERIIIELHARWGNRWSTIARSLPGRTDNEIKNYWRTHFKKKAKSSTKSWEKSRAHQLRRHQFQQHQQDQLDMEKIMSLFDESDPRMQIFTQLRQDMVYPSAPEQGFFHSMTNGYASVPDQTSNQDMIISDGFWNLDDVHGNITNWANYQRSFASNFY